MSDKNLFAALSKKATGFSEDEIVEEYQTDADGVLTLQKRKISTKYYPPDTAAIKSMMDMNTLETLSEEELENEKRRLLLEFAEITQKNEVKNETKTK